MNDHDLCREHLDNGRFNDALTIARKLTRAAPGDMRARALLLEALYSKGEHAAVATEIASLEREKPGSPELQKLKVRFRKRG